jgi:hypothetical protein
MRSCRNCPAIWSAVAIMPAGSVDPMTVKCVSATPPITPSAATAQPVDRIDDVQITLEACAIEVDRDMARQDLARRQRRWQETTLGASKTKRLFTTPDESGAGDDRHPASSQWRPHDEGLRVEGWAGRSNDSIPCRLRYVFQSRHRLSSARHLTGTRCLANRREVL